MRLVTKLNNQTSINDYLITTGTVTTTTTSISSLSISFTFF